jgi:TatD DNase family protein
MYAVREALFHWFTGGEEVLRGVMDEGYYVSFTPSLTYSRRLQRLASMCNLSQVLTETDGPVSHYGEFKGRLTVPAFVVNVVEKLAEIHGKPLGEVEDQIARNCSNFFDVKLV